LRGFALAVRLNPGSFSEIGSLFGPHENSKWHPAIKIKKMKVRVYVLSMLRQNSKHFSVCPVGDQTPMYYLFIRDLIDLVIGCKQTQSGDTGSPAEPFITE
jgi:hypothetical protein